ncbi:MAG: hypothetical protein C0616_14540 [Desulfuromonas sp.]|nr:MAG: hypothetical protein C0616_14540 [Desulfuromonas sp.]
MNRSRNRLSAASILFGVLLTSACIAGFGLAWLQHKQADELARQQKQLHQQQLTKSAENIEVVLHEASDILAILSRQTRFPIDYDELSRRMELALEALPDHLEAALFLRDKEGNILASSPRDFLSRMKMPPHLLAQPGSLVTGPTGITTRVESFLLLHQPLPSRQRQLSFSAALHLDKLVNNTLDDSRSRGKQLFIIDNSGLQLYPNRHLKPLAELETLPSVRNGMISGRTDCCQLPGTPWDEQPALASYSPLAVPGAKWSIALVSPLPRTVFGHWSILGLGVSGLLLSGGAIWRVRKQGSQHPGKTAEQVDTLEKKLDHLQDELTKSRHRTRQILDFAADALLYVDPASGQVIDHNQASRDLLGYSAKELNLLALEQLVPFEQQSLMASFLGKLAERRFAEDRTMGIQTREGSTIPVSIRARFGQLGHCPVVHMVLRDITSEHRIETELLQKNRDLQLLNQIAHATAGSQKLNHILDVTLDMLISAMQADGGGIYLLRHEGRSLDLAAHQNIAEKVIPELEKLLPQQGLVGRVVTTGKPVSSVNLQKDKRLWFKSVLDAGWLGFQAVPLSTQERTLGVLFLFNHSRRVFSRDEVELLISIGKQVGQTVAGAELLEAIRWQNRLTKASNRELEISRHQLRKNLKHQEDVNLTMSRLESMKNRFLAVASHELRTPLTYILSGSELLQNRIGQVDDSNQKLLEMVFQGGQRLNNIVDDLFEVARLEAEELYLGRRAIAVKDLFHGVQNRFRDSLSERELKLSILAPADLPELFGDPDHLGRTLDRMVENAIKFTSRGGEITLGAQTINGEDIGKRQPELEMFAPKFFLQPLHPRYLKLTIGDTGIGIDSDELCAIFDKFHSAGDISQHFSSQKEFGGKGVGLGLALARGMVEAHGGMIWVESAAGQNAGSCFHILIPAFRPEVEKTGQQA